MSFQKPIVIHQMLLKHNFGKMRNKEIACFVKRKTELRAINDEKRETKKEIKAVIEKEGERVWDVNGRV